MWRLALAVTLAGLPGCDRVFGLTDRIPADVATVDAPLLETSLVVHYAMDDDPTSGTIGAVPTSLRGTCAAGICPTKTTRNGSGAYAFASAAIDLPLSEVIHAAKPFTVAFWCKPSDSTQIQYMLGKANPDATDTFGLYITATGTVSVELTPYVHIDGVIPVIGAWHHVVMTWSGTTAIVALYVDGMLEFQQPRATVDRNGRVVLGADFDSNGFVFQFAGALDDLSVYSAVLDTASIQEIARP